MAKKEFAVFGLGEFGKSVALHMEQGGCEVLAVDNSEEKVQDIADYVTQAVRADVRDPEVVRSLGIKNMDGVVVAISDNLEASIMATIIAKECGVPYILAKAKNEVQATVLKKIGADEIIFPERAMGVRTAMNMISGNFLDLVDLSADFSIVEVPVPKAWLGKNLRELRLRDQMGLNIIARKTGEDLEFNLHPDDIMSAGEHYIIAGENHSLEKLK